MTDKKKNQRLAEHFAILASGTVAAQGIAILASPLLTRLYAPEAFGIFAAFTALLGVIGVISNFGYTIAIPLARNDAEAIRILLIAAGAVVGITIAVTIVVVFLGTHFAVLLGTPDAGVYLWLLPTVLLVGEAVSVFSHWALRKKAFARVSWSEAGQAAVSVAAQTFMGLFHFGAKGLILGKVAGLVVAYAALHRPAVREIRQTGPLPPFKDISATAREYYQFPVYRMPAMLINMLTRQLPFLAMPILFGAGPSGLYALTNRVMYTPATLISYNISRVFLSTAMDSKSAGTLPETTLVLVRSLVLISLPTFALFGLVAPEAFTFVFGEPWRQSGIYAQWLLPGMFLTFICSPLWVLPMVFNRQRVEVVFQWVNLCGPGLAMLGGGLLQSADIAIGLLALAQAVSWTWYLIWGTSLIDLRPHVIVTIIVREVIYALPFLVPVIALRLLEYPSAMRHVMLLVALASLALLLTVIGFRVRRHFKR